MGVLTFGTTHRRAELGETGRKPRDPMPQEDVVGAEIRGVAEAGVLQIVHNLCAIPVPRLHSDGRNVNFVEIPGAEDGPFVTFNVNRQKVDVADAALSEDLGDGNTRDNGSEGGGEAVFGVVGGDAATFDGRIGQTRVDRFAGPVGCLKCSDAVRVRIDTETCPFETAVEVGGVADFGGMESAEVYVEAPALATEEVAFQEFVLMVLAVEGAGGAEKAAGVGDGVKGGEDEREGECRKETHCRCGFGCGRGHRTGLRFAAKGSHLFRGLV